MCQALLPCPLRDIFQELTLKSRLMLHQDRAFSLTECQYSIGLNDMYSNVYDPGDLTVHVETIVLNLYDTGKVPGRSINFL